jgi:hypothetical protein
VTTGAADARVVRKLGDDRGAYQLVRAADPSGPRVGQPRVWDARNLLALRFSAGRRRAGEDFPAKIITWSYPLDPDADPNVANRYDSVRVGDQVSLDLTTGALDTLGIDVNDYQRGVGFVTDVQLSYRRLGRQMLGVVDVTAVGAFGRIGQTRIGLTAIGRSTGPTRANLLLDAVDQQLGDQADTYSTTSHQTIGVETVQLRTVDLDHTDPVSLLKSWAADSGALLIENMSVGNLAIRWETLDGRRNREPVVSLTADELAATATWSAGLQGLVNKMTLTYGDDPNRAEVTVTDDDSIARFGEYAVGRDTDLVYLADAQRIARLTVGRNSRPRPGIERLDFNVLDQLPAAKAGALVGADVGDLVELAGLPASAPYSRWVYIEGHEVTVTADTWRLTVYVSPAGRTGAPVRWQDVTPDLTWAQATADETGEPLTWLSAAGWFDPPNAGAAYRWVDVPTDQQWWHIGRDYFGNPEARDSGDTRVPTWQSYPNDP